MNQSRAQRAAHLAAVHRNKEIIEGKEALLKTLEQMPEPDVTAIKNLQRKINKAKKALQNMRPIDEEDEWNI
jgi:ribosomal 50S subunit-associated protein YjgA (DUF615 family)